MNRIQAIHSRTPSLKEGNDFEVIPLSYCRILSDKSSASNPIKYLILLMVSLIPDFQNYLLSERTYNVHTVLRGVLIYTLSPRLCMAKKNSSNSLCVPIVKAAESMDHSINIWLNYLEKNTGNMYGISVVGIK